MTRGTYFIGEEGILLKGWKTTFPTGKRGGGEQYGIGEREPQKFFLGGWFSGKGQEGGGVRKEQMSPGVKV